MRTIKRLGASVLAMGLVAVGMVATAPLASAHTTTLTPTSVCQEDGTYLVTYHGETFNTGGKTGDLSLTAILPAGTEVNDAPKKVEGNTTYQFTQVVPGTATSASVTAKIVWPGAEWSATAPAELGGNCKPPVTPKAPSGNLQKDCVNDLGHVFAGKLDKGTVESVSWQLVTGTNDVHHTVVAGPASGEPLEVFGLANGTKVWLQYDAGQGFVDETAVVTTGNCSVNPSASYDVVCTESGALVTVSALDDGTMHNVIWTLIVNGVPHTAHAGDLVVPALATLALTYTIGEGDTVTVKENRAPEACPPIGEVDKTSVPASGSVVDPSQTVTYTVHVSNTGDVKIVNKPAVDTLPDHVTLVAGSISGGGTASADGRSITWSVTLDPQESATYHYAVTVDADAPARAALLNRVTFLHDEATTTHEVGERSLGIVKSVTPTGAAEFGDTLTYTLVVTAGGNLGQTDVSVSDYIPGYKPGRDSGTTTYVAGSAACDSPGTCTTGYDDTAKLVTWGLGDMAPGTSRTVTFQVVIDSPVVDSLAEVPAVTIFNSAAVASTETPKTPSNEVVTPVTAVLGVIHHKPPTSNQPTAVLGVSLAHTGAPAHLPWTLSLAALLMLAGSSLIFLARKPEAATI